MFVYNSFFMESIIKRKAIIKQFCSISNKNSPFQIQYWNFGLFRLPYFTIQWMKTTSLIGDFKGTEFWTEHKRHHGFQFVRRTLDTHTHLYARTSLCLSVYACVRLFNLCPCLSSKWIGGVLMARKKKKKANGKGDCSHTISGRDAGKQTGKAKQSLSFPPFNDDIFEQTQKRKRNICLGCSLVEEGEKKRMMTQHQFDTRTVSSTFFYPHTPPKTIQLTGKRFDVQQFDVVNPSPHPSTERF